MERDSIVDNPERPISTTPRLLDPQFQYRDSSKTNVAETFKRFGFVPPSEARKQEEAK